MTADFSLLLLAGILAAAGVYLLLERALIKILLGILLISNGINLLILAAGGPPGNPPILGRGSADRAHDADTLAQAMILTSIVITAGVGAFILALAYRSYRFTTVDEVADDPEDAKIASRSPADLASAPDRDRSDNPVTGAPTEAGDTVDYDSRPGDPHVDTDDEVDRDLGDEGYVDGAPDPGGEVDS